MQNLGFENADVTYDPNYLSRADSNNLYNSISQLFTNEEKRMINDENDKPIYTLNRKTIAFIDSSIDRDVIPKIWGKNITVLEFTPELYEIKTDLESILNFKFNICLANYYDTGKNSIGWHCDNEEKGSTSCIASISLGAERLFTFRKRGMRDIYKSIVLNHGSLLVMGKGCQENYDHSLPVDKTIKDPRLNLTFRLFDSDRYKNF